MVSITWLIKDRRYAKADYNILKDDYEEMRSLYIERGDKFEYWKIHQSDLIAKYEAAGAAWNSKRITWEEADQVNQDTITTLQEANQSLQQMIQTKDTQIFELDQRYLQTVSRVEGLEEALNIERKRFDDAIQYQREVEDGQRYRLGQIPRTEDVSRSPQRPISTRRPPWSEVAKAAEAKSRKPPVKEVQQTEEHWKGKIAEVEKQDKEKAERNKK